MICKLINCNNLISRLEDFSKGKCQWCRSFASYMHHKNSIQFNAIYAWANQNCIWDLMLERYSFIKIKMYLSSSGSAVINIRQFESVLSFCSVVSFLKLINLQTILIPYKNIYLRNYKRRFMIFNFRIWLIYF